MLTIKQALIIGDKLGINWKKIDIKQFIKGYSVELEHGSKHAKTDVTHNDPILTAKIVLAHLHELKDYYTRLQKMEADRHEH